MFKFLKNLKIWLNKRKIRNTFAILFSGLSPLERTLWKQRLIRLKIEDSAKQKNSYYAIVALREIYERRSQR